MTLEEKFARLVQMVQRDIATLQGRLQAVEGHLQQRQMQTRSMNGTEIEWGVPESEEIVAVNPVTQQGIKAREVTPRLAMKFQFSEDE